MVQGIDNIIGAAAVTASSQPATVVSEAESDFSDILNSAASSSGTTNLDDIFERAAAKFNVPVNLLKAIAKTESNFDPNAVSHCGAKGIMQLMPVNCNIYGVTDPYDPEQNIFAGAQMISELLDRYDGNLELALAGYNAGIGNVAKYGGIPPFKETQAYIQRVTEYLGYDNIETTNKYAGLTRNTSGSQYRTASYDSGSGLSSDTLKSLEIMFMQKLMEMAMSSDDDEDKNNSIPL